MAVAVVVMSSPAAAAGAFSASARTAADPGEEMTVRGIAGVIAAGSQAAAAAGRAK
jgi:hypothetical protein